jgi:biotin transport system substrate-specific component
MYWRQSSSGRAVFQRLNKHRIHVGPDTLADRFYAPSLLMDVVLILAGVATIAVLAQFAVVLWPVPSTGQIIAVLCVGFAFGPVRGALSLLIYIALGAAGLPIFADAGAGLERLLGPSGGFFAGFVLAAVMAGISAQFGLDRRLRTALPTAVALTLAIYVCGIVWLVAAHDYDFMRAVTVGVLPLLPAALVKAAAASIIMVLAWRADARRVEAEQATIAARVDMLRN